MRAHRRLLVALALGVACAAHEPPQEPTATCPEGMVRIAGAQGGATPGDLCVDLSEVTTAAYAACVDAGACRPALLDGERCNLRDGARGDHPVNCVSYEQAQAHCEWLGKRLLSEGEWLATVQAGDATRRYPWGRATLSSELACVGRDEAAGTCPVGAHPKGASADGVVDLIGNVAEWVTVAARKGTMPGVAGGSWKTRRVAGIGDPEGTGQEVAPIVQPSSRRDAGAPTLGFRCAVAPFTAVQAIPDRPFVPLQEPAREHPRLAVPIARPRPTRPLANLTVLARIGEGTPPRTLWWPAEESFVGLDEASAAALGPLASESLAYDALPPGLGDLRPLHSLGSSFLLTGGWSRSTRFVALGREGRRIRWQRSMERYGASMVQAVSARALIVAIYADASDALVAFALDDGSELWRIDGASDCEINRVRQLWVDDDRLMVVGDRGLAAIDPQSGAFTWAEVAVGEGCGVVSGDGLVIVEAAEGGHRVIDGASGGEVGRLPLSSRGGCVWAMSAYDGGVAPAAIEGGVVFALDPPSARGITTLRAIELASGRERWQREGLSGGILVADHDAVYVERGGKRLVALAREDGAQAAEIWIDEGFVLNRAGGGGEAGPLLVAKGGTTGEWILGRGPEPALPERFEIRGRLVADEGVGKRRVSGVLVRVGDVRVRTDAQGRFVARGRARGAIPVAPGDERDPYELVKGGARIFRFDPSHVILDGSGSYDVGEISLYEWFSA